MRKRASLYTITTRRCDTGEPRLYVPRITGEVRIAYPPGGAVTREEIEAVLESAIEDIRRQIEERWGLSDFG